VTQVLQKENIQGCNEVMITSFTLITQCRIRTTCHLYRNSLCVGEGLSMDMGWDAILNAMSSTFKIDQCEQNI